MSLFSVPRFILSSTTSGIGKSLLGIGLSVAFKKRDINLSCCVIGPRLAEATAFRRMSRRFVYSLDEKLLSREQMISCIYNAGVGADLLFIEGHKGLYDGYISGLYRGSDASIAELTKTPVVLAFDSRGFEASIAAVIKGYTELARGFQVSASIANRMPIDQNRRDELKATFDDALIEAGLPTLVGAVPEIEINEHEPIDQVSELVTQTLYSRQFLIDLANFVNQYIDLESLVKIAQTAAKLKIETPIIESSSRRCRVAFSDDVVFNLSFQDNLDLLKINGADVVSFSPLADLNLPKDIGAVYLTGGCLARYANDLAKNKSMRQALLNFYNSGGVIYAEGSGAAYLCSKIRVDENQEYEGVGLIPATACLVNEGLSYVDTVTIDDSILGRSGLILKGISTGNWVLNYEDTNKKTMRVLRSSKSPAKVRQIVDRSAYLDGYSPGAQVVASFSYFHWGSNPQIAKNIVEAAAVVRRL